ncbi:MAG: hypothetical protein JW734_00570 [Candidatus Omnitrophica bacterium]|nr:hypothetical protein [Candidatus Omnitrophota bacterium]
MTKKNKSFDWENRKERIRRHMRITPKNKLIWLKEFNEFLHKALSKKKKRIHSKLRLQ